MRLNEYHLSRTTFLLTSLFEVKRAGLNDAVGAIDCMLEETIERLGVIIAIGRVVDVVVREGEPLLFFRGAYPLSAQKKGRARKWLLFRSTA